jgi:hypothetical protein
MGRTVKWAGLAALGTSSKGSSIAIALWPPPGALSEEEILQHKLSISRHKRATADATGYLLIRCLGPSFNFDQLIERIAVRASECIEPTAINHDTLPIAQFLIVIS